jgi:hypothetical protein
MVISEDYAVDSGKREGEEGMFEGKPPRQL